jgi:hypothetical protein
MRKLQTHLWNPCPAKSVNIGKPPKSFMSISFDSPSQSQVPNLIQYCSWNAVTAHSKRARIHIWRKVWKNFFGRNFVNFIADGRPGKVFLHPTFTVVRALRWWPSQRAIKKIYFVYFLEFILKMIFIIIFVFFAVVLKISIDGWVFYQKKLHLVEFSLHNRVFLLDIILINSFN